uniref:JHL10I11.7 protein n=1 Tax=Rhizophora mucronata TaxID=61149 RepID=A0A2P2MBH6_RHIMU
MAQDTSRGAEAPRRPYGLLRDQFQLVKKKDSNRYEIVPVEDTLSFEKGFFIVIRACQLLAQKNDGLILVGIAGPSGAGKTLFTVKVLNFVPSIAVIPMDNYNDSSRIVDGNFDDPRVTDYETLLDNIHGLKAGKSVQVPIYDFKTTSQTGYRTVEVPSSRIVIIEGIYALSERLRPLLDLRVSITGGVHSDLVKRVLRDIQRAGQDPEEIIHQISETVHPMYKAFIEPDLQTAHIKIISKFNPFSGFQNPTYILKSTRSSTDEQIKAILSEKFRETKEETYDIYLLPPGEDPEACHSYLRMRNRDGKYNLMFEVQGRDRLYVKHVAEQLGLDGSYVAHTYIEQIQLEKLVNEAMALPEDLKTKLSIDDDMVLSPKEALSRASADRRNKYLSRSLSHSYANQQDKNLSKLTKLAVNNRRFDGRSLESPATLANQGVITQLSEQISTLNERMDEFTSRIEELNSKFAARKVSACQQNLALQAEACNGTGPTSLFVTGMGNGSLTGSLLRTSSSASQLARENPLMEEILLIARGQRQIVHQLDNLSNLLHEYQGERSHQERADRTNNAMNPDSLVVPLILTLAVGGLGIFLFRGLTSQK